MSSDYLSSLTGTSSYYTDQYSASTSSLQDTLNNTDYSTATDEELMEACKSFEQYFIEQALKGMEKMIPDNDDEDSSTSYVEMFKDTLYQEYAEIASDQVNGTSGNTGLGIAQMLYEQMKRNYSSVSTEELAQSAVTSGAVETDTEEE